MYFVFTGKTSGVKFVCERVIETTQIDDDCRSPVLCYLNAVSIRASPDPVASLFSEMAFNAGFQNCKSAASLKQLLSRSPQKFVILILDEIDALVSDSKLESYTKPEQALKKVLDCAADEHYPLALIGISNTIGSDKYERLQAFGKVRRFDVYNVVYRNTSIIYNLLLSGTVSAHHQVSPIYCTRTSIHS
jgi:Cdc6-like AAA superfamily ATPase